MSVAVRPVGIRSWPDTVPDDTHTLGWPILAWTADYLTQPDGPKAGEPFEFTAEQVRILLRWYQIDEAGRFVYHRGVLRRMKGWGKDPFLAVLSCVELVGPCRFGGWNRDGSPLVVPHSAPWIQVAAVSKDQTRNTMTLFPGLFSQQAKLEYGLEIGKEVIYCNRPHKGRIEAVTSSPRALEGSRPSLVVLNETQHWLVNNEGPEMEAAIRRNLGKSRDGAARAFEITNAHLVGELSVAEATYEAWRASDGDLRGVYYDSLEARPVPDLTDPEIVEQAVIEARGDSTWVDVRRIGREIADPTTSESLARRYYLNQVWETGAEQWISDYLWKQREKPGLTIPDGLDVMLGVDGSYNDDSTGIVVANCGPEPHLMVVKVWEKEEDPDWTVPILEVENEIRKACKKWRVREICFDPYRWARTMQVLHQEGLPVVEYPQSPERMVPACARFLEAVVNGTLSHNGDLALARHISNVVVREGSRGVRIVKETKWSPRKIDLAVAAVMAHDRAAGRVAVGAGWLQAWRSQSHETPPSGQAAAAKPAQPAAAAPTPRAFFGEPAPVAAMPSTCQHRWWSDGICVKCGEHKN